MKITNNGFLLNDDPKNIRVFLPSKDINIFPCSRRGRARYGTYTNEDNEEKLYEYYDPEARLNTERTNRLHTAVNGFANSFIESYDAETRTLIFVLAGYRIEINTFGADAVKTDLEAALKAALGADAEGTNVKNIYAHLRLHTDVSLLTAGGYSTEVLYRQVDLSDAADYLDVPFVYTAEGTTQTQTDDFFVGVSFTAAKVEDAANSNNYKFYNLPLFSAKDDEWEPVQTSFLPKIEHDETDGSIKVNGDFTVKHGDKTSFKVTNKETVLGPTVISSIIAGESAEGEIFSEGTIKAKERIEAPTLKVTTVNSMQENGTITIVAPTKFSSTLEVTGDTIIKSNLEVVDNINVGIPATPADADNGGCIVAQYDITAEEDLIAKRDINAGGNLTVGTDSNTDTGTITAKKLVKAPVLEATNQLNVQSSSTTSPAEANIDKANITNANITGALTVHDDSNTAQIKADIVTINKNLTVYDTITANKTFSSNPTKVNLDVKKAKIDTLSSTTATVSTVNSDDINQKIGEVYYDVPVVFVQQLDSTDSNVYQLQISRANVLQYKTN